MTPAALRRADKKRRVLYDYWSTDPYYTMEEIGERNGVTPQTAYVWLKEMLPPGQRRRRKRWITTERPRLNTERDAEIRRRRAEEAVTLEELARQYGITRERVRQICKGVVPARVNRTEMLRTMPPERRAEIESRHTTLNGIGKELGVAPQVLSKLGWEARAQRSYEEWKPVSAQVERRTDYPTLVAAFAAYMADTDGPYTVKRYAEWGTRTGVDPITPQTVHVRLRISQKTTVDLLTDAGAPTADIDAARRRVRPYPNRVDAETATAHIAAFVAHQLQVDRPPTRDMYEQWRRTVRINGVRPVVASTALRAVGTNDWGAVIARTADAMNGDGNAHSNRMV